MRRLQRSGFIRLLIKSWPGSSPKPKNAPRSGRTRYQPYQRTMFTNVLKFFPYWYQTPDLFTASRVGPIRSPKGLWLWRWSRLVISDKVLAIPFRFSNCAPLDLQCAWSCFVKRCRVVVSSGPNCSINGGRILGNLCFRGFAWSRIVVLLSRQYEKTKL